MVLQDVVLLAVQGIFIYERRLDIFEVTFIADRLWEVLVVLNTLLQGASHVVCKKPNAIVAFDLLLAIQSLGILYADWVFDPDPRSDHLPCFWQVLLWPGHIEVMDIDNQQDL